MIHQRITDIYTLKTRINDTTARADCKYIGLHSGWNERKSGLGEVRVTSENKFRARAGPGEFLKFRPVRLAPMVQKMSLQAFTNLVQASYDRHAVSRCTHITSKAVCFAKICSTTRDPTGLQLPTHCPSYGYCVACARYSSNMSAASHSVKTASLLSENASACRRKHNTQKHEHSCE
jgi:hypothetical protein